MKGTENAGVAGEYQVAMRTPLGNEQGRLTLTDADGVLSGSIRAMGAVNHFAGGRTDGAHFSFQGILRFGFLKIPYSARGEIRGDTLTAAADTRYGSFSLQGKRIRDKYK